MPLPDTPLPRYAWPGGYVVHYVDVSGPDDIGTYGDILCASCAWGAIVRDDTPMVQTGYPEGPTIRCDDCGIDMPSDYGDPDEL